MIIIQIHIKTFEKAYNELKQYSGRLGCHVLKTHQLNNIDPLSYILNDNIKEGMNLAAIYQYFIDFQNNFINNIFGQKLLHKDLGYFSEGINNAIYIQDANINDIVSLQINTPLFKEFEQIISIYSKREIFGKNEINYYNYKNINYNLDKIEIELGKIILSGKRKFKEEQKYITYMFEEYRNKSDIIPLFMENYPQKSINEEIKGRLINFILEETKEYKEIISSINKLIFYSYNKSFKTSDNVFDIIQNIPKHINLINKCFNLFENIKIEHLIEVYEYVELQFFKLILIYY
jgi:hypothetical protein